MSLTARLLAPLEGGAEERAVELPRALLWLLLVYVPIDFVTLAASLPAGSAARWRAVLAAGGGAVALALAVRPASRRLAAGLALAILAAAFVWVFPGSSNHRFLALVSLGVLVSFRLDDEREAGAALATLRWLTLIMLFWTGLQKLLYGTYFQAEYLSWQVARGGRFASAFGWLLGEAELQRLLALPATPAGEAIYRSRAPALLIAANGTWLLELVLPVVLFLRRTRAAALAVALAFIALVETAALELTFGVLFLGLLLLFAPPRWLWRFVPVAGGVLLLVLLARLGWVPLGGLN